MYQPHELAGNPTYRFSTFEFQPSEHRLISNNQEIPLGARTLDLLNVLVSNAGKLVTKEFLFKYLWPQVVVEENNLHVHISTLRKVLGHSAIVTISGKGYRFTEKVFRDHSDVNNLTEVNNLLDNSVQGLKVLLVDDHSLIRDALKSVIKEMVGNAQILEASSLKEAKDWLVQNTDIEMIILDLQLSDSNGIESLQTIRSEYPAVPVVIVSADSEKNRVKAAIANGAQGYIPKSTPRSVMMQAFKLIFSGGNYIPTEAITSFRR